MATSNCVFCKICDGSAPSTTLYKTDKFIVFRALGSMCKNHLLVCPIQHIRDAKCLDGSQKNLVEEMLQIGKQVLLEQGEDMSNARFGFHWPPFFSISHLHLHVISPTSELSFFKNLIYKPNSFWFVSPEYVISRLEQLK